MTDVDGWRRAGQSKFMRKWRKIILIFVGVGVMGGVTAYFNAGRLIRMAIVRETTDSLGVSTTLDTAHVSLKNGRLILTDFTISNPRGYSAGDVLDLQSAEIDAPLSQLRSRTIHVSQVDFYSPRLLLERHDGKWNVQMLGHASADPLRLYIDQVRVVDAVVTVKLNLAPGARPMVVTIPPFTMENIKASDGSGRGATIKDALMQITRVMTSKAISPDDLARGMDSELPFGIHLPIGGLFNVADVFGVQSK